MLTQFTNKQEFRWSIRKKGTQIFNICTRFLLLQGVAVGLMLGASGAAFANPAGGAVVGGSATIANTATELQINQTSPSAIINWNSFNISAGETTHFIQPSASAVALNRVVNSTELSAINGSLQANGKVFVINPNGVLIGNGANIDTAGFIASTADIANDAFMNSTGTYNFNKAGAANASVVNQGHITVADEGLVAFVAPNVSNSGLIEGNLARIQLGAADTFVVDLYGDGLISMAVAAPQGSGTRSISATNSGSIITDGGKVLMTAAAASDVVNSAINNSGVIQAQSLVNHNGQITLTGAGADVAVSGNLDVSGANGGGSVKIGGDYQGGGTLAHAATATVADGTVINASATDNGNGGTVVVWSDYLTAAHGHFMAQGGANGGNGGSVETSSGTSVEISGLSVDTSAAAGKVGTWLLDPTWSGGSLTVDAGMAAAIDAAAADVFLVATNSITFAADIAMVTPNVNFSATSGIGGILHVGAPSNYLYTNGGNVTFDATTGGPVSLNDYVIHTRGGNVSLTGGAVSLYGSSAAIGTSGGTLTIAADTASIYDNAQIDTAGGGFTTNAGTSSIYNGALISTYGGDFNSVATGASSIYSSANISTGGGAFNMTGEPLSIYSSAVIGTAGGVVNLTGSAVNVYSAADINTGGGVVNIQGAAVSLYDFATIVTTGGAVNITPIGAGVTAAILVDYTTIDTTGGATAGGINFQNADGTPFFPSATTDALKEAAFGTTNAFDSTQNGGILTMRGSSMGGGYNCFNAGGGLSCTGINSEPILAVVNHPIDLTVTADAQTKVYGSLDPTLTYTYIGLQPGDAFTGNLLRLAGETVAAGPYAINQGTLAVNGFTSYHFTYVGNNLVITPYLLPVTADAQSKLVGAVDPALTYTYGTLQNGDTNSVFSGSLARIAGETVAAGPYAINQGTLLAGSNYTVDYTGNFLTITANAEPIPTPVPTPQTAQVGPSFEIAPLERPIISVANHVLVYDAPFEPIETLTMKTDVSIRLVPTANGSITSAEALSAITPAAGGNGSMAPNNEVSCANAFLNNQPCETQY